MEGYLLEQDIQKLLGDINQDTDISVANEQKYGELQSRLNHICENESKDRSYSTYIREIQNADAFESLDNLIARNNVLVVLDISSLASQITDKALLVRFLNAAANKYPWYAKVNISRIFHIAHEQPIDTSFTRVITTALMDHGRSRGDMHLVTHSFDMDTLFMMYKNPKMYNLTPNSVNDIKRIIQDRLESYITEMVKLHKNPRRELIGRLPPSAIDLRERIDTLCDRLISSDNVKNDDITNPMTKQGLIQKFQQLKKEKDSSTDIKMYMQIQDQMTQALFALELLREGFDIMQNKVDRIDDNTQQTTESLKKIEQSKCCTIL